jgi:hypothetical protein
LTVATMLHRLQIAMKYFAFFLMQDQRPDSWSGLEKLRTADWTNRGLDQRPVFGLVPDQTTEMLHLIHPSLILVL